MKKSLKIILTCILGLSVFSIAFATPFIITRANEQYKNDHPPFDIEKDGFVQIRFEFKSTQYSYCFNSDLNDYFETDSFETEDFDVFCFLRAEEKTESKLYDVYGNVLTPDMNISPVLSACDDIYASNSFLSDFTIYQINKYYIVTAVKYENTQHNFLYFYKKDKLVRITKHSFQAAYLVGIRFLK